MTSQSYVVTDKGTALFVKLTELKKEFETDFTKKGSDINICNFSGTQKGERPAPEGLSSLS